MGVEEVELTRTSYTQCPDVIFVFAIWTPSPKITGTVQELTEEFEDALK